MADFSSGEIVKERSKRLKVGLIIIYVGLGINLFGFASLGSYLEGVGLLVMALGVGIVTADYIYPNTSEELTNAVEEYEKE